MPRRADPKMRALREAERLNRVKDNLLAAMSHDLRTPLGSVQVWLELLRAQDLDPSAARAVGMIDRSMRDLNDLLAQFLDMSRLLAGEVRLEKHATDLIAVVDAVLASAGDAARAKGVRLEGGRVDRSLPTLHADSPRLRQALECLVVNAVKATPAGGIVELELQRVDGRVRIRVRDTGPGIPPEQLTAVFDQFRSGNSPGGLGLAIAQRVAELHGGRIHAASEGEGRGSVFVLELPLEGP